MLAQLLASYTYNYNYMPVSGPAAAGLASFFIILWLAILALSIVLIVAMWKVFVKAGQPGWASIVPLYNLWVLAEVAGKPGWWGLYGLIAWVPIIGWVLAIVVSIMLALGVARNFGQSDAFGVFGLWLFAPIGYLILGFGDAKYQPRTDQPAQPSQPAQPPAQLAS